MFLLPSSIRERFGRCPMENSGSCVPAAHQLEGVEREGTTAGAGPSLDSDGHAL